MPTSWSCLQPLCPKLVALSRRSPPHKERAQRLCPCHRLHVSCCRERHSVPPSLLRYSFCDALGHGRNQLAALLQCRLPLFSQAVDRLAQYCRQLANLGDVPSRRSCPSADITHCTDRCTLQLALRIMQLISSPCVLDVRVVEHAIICSAARFFCNSDAECAQLRVGRSLVEHFLLDVAGGASLAHRMAEQLDGQLASPLVRVHVTVFDPTLGRCLQVLVRRP